MRANGIPVQRHTDRCTLNNGNCPGEYVHVKSTATHPAPDAKDQQDKAWYQEAWDATKEQGGHFWKGVTSTSDTAAIGQGIVGKLGDYVGDPAQILRDGQSLYHSLPTGSQIWQGTKNIASGAATVAGHVWNDPVGAPRLRADGSRKPLSVPGTASSTVTTSTALQEPSARRRASVWRSLTRSKS